MKRPQFFPQSTATKHTQYATGTGLVLYTLYLLFIIFGIALTLAYPESSFNSLTNQLTLLIIAIALLLIEILLPIFVLRQLYKNSLTRYRNLLAFVPVTLTGLRSIYLAPLTIYNIALLIYLYYTIKYQN